LAVDQRLIDAAIELAIERWPDGEAGAAAMYTATGRLLTSVFANSPNEGARLCHETGAICEAHKLGEAVTASVCVHRDSALSPFIILPPCGLCVERLAYWGRDVEVAVPRAGENGAWLSKRLREVQPYYWRDAWPPADDFA
jgi:cytidine deaminase